MIRKLFCLILVTMLAGAGMAQDVSIRADHPDEYIVVRGDTLWDISARFLDKPWQWPAIWHANPQIENPHLIYPGDRISLVYVDGKARLVVDRGKPVRRLSPDIRTVEREAVTAIPYDSLSPFIRTARVIGKDQLDGLPYIVANEEQAINAAQGDRTYARGLSGSVGQQVMIARTGNVYYRLDGKKKRGVRPEGFDHVPDRLEVPGGFWRPVNTWGKEVDIIGYELYEVSRATILKTGDPAILSVDSVDHEVTAGDYILPLDDHVFAAQFMPRAMDRIPDGLTVLAIQGIPSFAGHNQIVAVSGGSSQGVEAGHVFSAFRPGETIRDDVKYPSGSMAAARTRKDDIVTLPDEYNAHIMVFRVFNEVSYAMVMDGDRPVSEGDILRHPDETL